MTGQAIVIQGDARRLPLSDESVDCIVTSPPYFALRSYRDDGEHYTGQIGSEPTPQEFLEALWECTAEMTRVLKPSGSIFVNLGDKYAGSGGNNNSGVGRPQETQWDGDRRIADTRKIVGFPAKSLMLLPHRYAIGCIDRLGLIVRQDQVWSKPNGLPESVTDRTRRSHEYWFHMVKSPRYFAAVDEIREAHLEPNRIGQHDSGTTRPVPKEANHGKMFAGEFIRNYNPLRKLPSSVWSIPSEPLLIPAWAKEKYNLPDHFAAFPTEWPRRLILGWAPPDGIILDPFGGTGTTALVARALGRVGISVDLSHDYCELARWRIFESGHGKKAMARTNAERQGMLL